jgi:phosphate transport system substrate-binding protein
MRPSLVAVLLLVACDGRDGPAPAPASGEGPAAGLRIGGTDVLAANLLAALAAEFEKQNADAHVAVTGNPRDNGIEQLLRGEVDLGAATRDATPSEDEQAKVAGWSFATPQSRHIVGVDVVAVAVNDANRIEHLTYDQVICIFCTGSITNWSAVGGPEAAITVVSREQTSGTSQLFEDFFCGPKGIKADAEHADRERVAGILRDDAGAVTFVTLSESTGRVVALAPEPEAPAVAPSQANVISGAYPLYRDVVLYSAGPPRGAAVRFLDWVASPAGQEVVDEQRYVPMDLRTERLDEPRPLRETVHFEPGATAPNQRSMERLGLLVKELRDRRLRHVVLEGYTDNTEPDPLELSRQRAETVQALLSEQLPGLYFEIIPRGPKNAIAPNDTPYGQLRNRRVQVYLGEEEGATADAITAQERPPAE